MKTRTQKTRPSAEPPVDLPDELARLWDLLTDGERATLVELRAALLDARRDTATLVEAIGLLVRRIRRRVETKP